MSLPRDDHSGLPPHGLDRTPPQNIDLEMSVLGGIMLEPKDAFPIVADILSRDSFYLEGHALIFEGMRDLHAQGIPPDSVAVLDWLRREVKFDDHGQQYHPLLNKVGGSGVVLGMLNSVPTAANVEAHAKRLHEKSLARQLIRCCTRVIEDCYKQELPFDEVLDRAESSILALSANASDKSYKPVGDYLAELMVEIVERSDEIDRQLAAGIANPTVTPGLQTGYVDLDRLTGGLQKQRLTIIAARPGLGKSALAANMIYNISVLRGLPTLLISLEMGGKEIAERLLCSGTKYTLPNGGGIAGVSTTRLHSPRLTDQEWSVLQQSYHRIDGTPILISDCGSLRPGELRSMVRRAHAEHGIEAVFLDYLQLMDPPIHAQGWTRAGQVGTYSRMCKQIAQELHIPVVALSQLNRDVEKTKRAPQLSDLRESGEIEQDADVVLFIHDPKPDPDRRDPLREVHLNCAKHRGGALSTVKLWFHAELTRFYSAAQQQQQANEPPGRTPNIQRKKNPNET